MAKEIPGTRPESPQGAVDVFQRDGQSDGMQVIRATTGAYRPGVTTGLTLGDLREAAKVLVDEGVYE